MKNKAEFELELKHSFRRMWVIAIIVAVLAIAPLAYFGHKAPWVVGIVIAAGVLIGLVFEIRADLVRRSKAKARAIALDQQRIVARSEFADTRARSLIVGSSTVFLAGTVSEPIGAASQYKLYGRWRDRNELIAQARETRGRSFSETARLVTSET